MLLAAIQVLQCWCIPDIGSVTAGFSVEVWEASVVYQITGRDRKINMYMVSAGSPMNLTKSTFFIICVEFAWLLKTDRLSGLQPFSD